VDQAVLRRRVHGFEPSACPAHKTVQTQPSPKNDVPSLGRPVLAFLKARGAGNVGLGQSCTQQVGAAGCGFVTPCSERLSHVCLYVYVYGGVEQLGRGYPCSRRKRTGGRLLLGCFCSAWASSAVLGATPRRTGADCCAD
jgi:hypothetical protein